MVFGKHKNLGFLLPSLTSLPSNEFEVVHRYPVYRDFSVVTGYCFPSAVYGVVIVAMNLTFSVLCTNSFISVVLRYSNTAFSR